MTLRMESCGTRSNEPGSKSFSTASSDMPVASGAGSRLGCGCSSPRLAFSTSFKTMRPCGPEP